MSLLLVVHIICGAVGLSTATVALMMKKGSAPHVRYGLIMWYTMLAMAVSGIFISFLIENWVLLLTGLMTIYMLFTGRNALTRLSGKVNLDVKIWTGFNLLCFTAAMAAGLSIIGGGDPSGGRFLALAADSLIFAVLDWRLITRGEAVGVDRVIDHLWRIIGAMLFGCFALFLFNPQAFPEWFIDMRFNLVPITIIFGVLVYWVVTLKWGRSIEKIVVH